ncbi:MAG: DUF1405 domain-containing protein [Candidatus Thermoplasmatota archaeon]
MESKLEPFWSLLERMRSSKLWFFLLLLPNLIGISFGYYYYYEVGQFNPASSYFRDYALWPFIPDSPNAVLLCLVALTGYTFFGKRSRLLDGIAFTAMLYVGLWTTFLFLAYPQQLGTFEWGSTNNLLFFSHMGMPLEALLFLPALRKDATSWAIAGAVVAWNLLNVGLDYWGPHLHPAPFLHPSDGVLHSWSPWVMAVTLVGYLCVTFKNKKAAKTKLRQPVS